MTATGNPRAALTACADALTPARNPQEQAAADLAREALKGDPYPAASLETAACIWEAVLDMRREGAAISTAEAATRGRLIDRAFEDHGTGAIRLTAIGWTDAVDSAWAAANAGGAFYDAPFDWEFVPDWITANIDWSGPGLPTILATPRVPVIAPGDTTRTAPALSDDVRFLIDDLGMTFETVGGGGSNLRHDGPHGSYLWVSCYGGGALPTLTDWHVTAYRSADCDGILTLTSEHEGRAGVTLAAAVNACCAVLADFTPPPEDGGDLFGVMIGYGPQSKGALIPETFIDYDAAQMEATKRANAPGRWACVYQIAAKGVPVDHAADDDDPPAAVIVDALDLLDCVESAGQDGDNAGWFITRAGDDVRQRYSFTVSSVG